VEASRTYADQQSRFEILTPADLEVQIFVDPKEAKNVPAELKERIGKKSRIRIICCRWLSDGGDSLLLT